MATESRRRHHSRTVAVVERRASLAKLIIALFVARIVITAAEIAESSLTWWSVLISLAIGIEAWRAWRVARAARQAATAAAPIPDSGWDRLLRPVERFGPAVLYVLTAIFVVVYIVLGNDGDQQTLLDITVIAREITTFAVVGVLIAGYQSVRER